MESLDLHSSAPHCFMFPPDKHSVWTLQSHGPTVTPKVEKELMGA